MPKSTITQGSSEEDVIWLQEQLNQVLFGESFIPLTNMGVYDNKTRIAVLIYWEKLGWNKDGKDTGWRAGKKTIQTLKEQALA